MATVNKRPFSIRTALASMGRKQAVPATRAKDGVMSSVGPPTPHATRRSRNGSPDRGHVLITKPGEQIHQRGGPVVEQPSGAGSRYGGVEWDRDSRHRGGRTAPEQA